MYHNVLEWLDKRAEETPERIGFADPDSEITYGELKRRASNVGAKLSGKIGIGEPVAFYLEKSTGALCGMFGAVYAGGFYCILDVRQPANRIHSILHILKSKILVADSSHWEKARQILESWEGEEKPELISLEELEREEIGFADLAAIRRKCTDTQPLYVNFTSGSTGVPKGVTVSHRSVIEFIGIFTDIFGIHSSDVLANQAPFDFDVSVKDIYSGLATGAKVQLIPREYFSNPIALMDYLEESQATVLVWAVSAMCFVSIMNGLEYRTPGTIRLIMFSGEVLPIKHLHIWQKYLPKATYVNLYGPTEITCNCTYHILQEEYADTDVIPIGRAFPNEKVFLLDEQDREVKDSGVCGEICVSGTCLALGYYGDSQKTNQVFVQNPLNTDYLERIYRTGDLGKYNEAGELVYVARKDFQIKHLGHRIELGEIEHMVMTCAEVTRSCCLYDREKQRLLLFFTGDGEKRSLMKKLRILLPPFMLPNQIFRLEEMPLNKNGKIDRNRLMEIYQQKRGD